MASIEQLIKQIIKEGTPDLRLPLKIIQKAERQANCSDALHVLGWMYNQETQVFEKEGTQTLPVSIVYSRTPVSLVNYLREKNIIEILG